MQQPSKMLVKNGATNARLDNTCIHAKNHASRAPGYSVYASIQLANLGGMAILS